MKEHKLLINGKWKESKEKREIQSPYNQSPVATIHFASPSQMGDAVTAAHEAFNKTKKLSSLERSQTLEKISSEIERRKEELARSITLSSGKTITSSRIEVERAVNTFSIASEEAKRIGGEIIPLDMSAQTKQRWGLVRHFPLGVISAISPFNFPLNLVAHKVAPAFASGNSVVLRSLPCFSVRSSVRQTSLPAA